MAKEFLHIGAFRNGKLVDEHHFKEKGAITVGRSAGTDIWMAGSKLPEQHTLVTFERKVAKLHVIAGMGGELALDGKTRQPLEALRSKGQPDGAGWVLELPETVRGWVTLGDATFFVQLGPKPPPPPKRTLPASAKTGVLSGLERTFSTVFAIAFVIESIGVVIVNRRPDMAPEAPLEQEDLDRFAEITMPDKKPEPEKKPDDDAKKKAEDDAKKAEEDAKKKAEEEAKKDKKPEGEVDEKAKAEKHAADVKKAVASSALLKVLGSAGDGSGIGSVFNKGLGSDISDAFAGAGGVKVASGDEGPEHKSGGGNGGVVGIGDIGAGAGGGGGHGNLGEKAHVAPPKITVDDSDVEIDSSTVDKDALNKFIRSRIRSITACYEKELKLSPTLKGKIVVRFTVTTAGRTGETTVDSDTMHSDNVSNCIVRTIKSWVYPFKPEEDVPVSFPFVFQPGG